MAEHLLRYFISIRERECFSACLYTCYELLKPDVVLELTWRFGLMEFAMPFLIQSLKDMNNRLEQVTKKTEDIQKKEEKKAQQEAAQPMPLEMSEMLMGNYSPYLQLTAPPEMMMGMQGGMGYPYPAINQ